jgi:hypothetical protein
MRAYQVAVALPVADYCPSFLPSRYESTLAAADMESDSLGKPPVLHEQRKSLGESAR